MGIGGVQSTTVDTVAVRSSVRYIFGKAVVGVCIAILIDACVLAIRARVSRGVGRVVLLLLVAHLLAAASSTIASVCLWLENSCDTAGGMRSLGVPVVLDVVVFALGNIDKDLIGSLRVNEVGCVDLLTRHSFVRVVLEGQLAVPR